MQYSKLSLITLKNPDALRATASVFSKSYIFFKYFNNYPSSFQIHVLHWYVKLSNMYKLLLKLRYRNTCTSKQRPYDCHLSRLGFELMTLWIPLSFSSERLPHWPLGHLSKTEIITRCNTVEWQFERIKTIHIA